MTEERQKRALSSLQYLQQKHQTIEYTLFGAKPMKDMDSFLKFTKGKEVIEKEKRDYANHLLTKYPHLFPKELKSERPRVRKIKKKPSLLDIERKINASNYAFEQSL